MDTKEPELIVKLASKTSGSKTTIVSVKKQLLVSVTDTIYISEGIFNKSSVFWPVFQEKEYGWVPPDVDPSIFPSLSPKQLT